MAVPPWIKFLSKPKLNNHISDTIEVGFGRFGPSLGISGTLATENHLVFVQNVVVELVLSRTRQTHRFSWFAFRPCEFVYQNITETDFLMPTKFIVTSTQAYKYNILFIDEDKYAEIKPFINDIRREWEHWAQSSASSLSPKESFESYWRGPQTSQWLEKLKTFFYWEPGEYIINLMILTQRPSRLLEQKRHFVLSQPEINDLRQNANVIIKDLCNQSDVLYHTLSLTLTK